MVQVHWVIVDWVSGRMQCIWVIVHWVTMHLGDSSLGHSAFGHRQWWCRVIVDWVTGSVWCIMDHSGQHWVWQDWECIGSQAGYGAFGHSGLNHSAHGYVYTFRVIVSWCQLIQARRYLLTGSCIIFFLQFVWSLHWLPYHDLNPGSMLPGGSLVTPCPILLQLQWLLQSVLGTAPWTW